MVVASNENRLLNLSKIEVTGLAGTSITLGKMDLQHITTGAFHISHFFEGVSGPLVTSNPVELIYINFKKIFVQTLAELNCSEVRGKVPPDK